MGCHEGVLHELNLLADFILQKHQYYEQAKRGEVENGELRALPKEIRINFVDDRIDSHNSIADSRPLYPSLHLFPANELKIQIKLPNQESQKGKEREECDNDEEDAEGLKAGPEVVVGPIAVEQASIIVKLT